MTRDEAIQQRNQIITDINRLNKALRENLQALEAAQNRLLHLSFQLLIREASWDGNTYTGWDSTDNPDFGESEEP